MKKILIGLLVLVLAGLSVACAGSSSENIAPSMTGKGGVTYSATTTSASQRFDANMPPALPSKGGEAASDNSGTWGSLSTPSTDRMVIRTGNVSLVVSNISTTLDNIAKMAVDYGGYVVTSQKWKEGERNNGNISFRILAENYDKSIAALRNMSLDVLKPNNV